MKFRCHNHITKLSADFRKKVSANQSSISGGAACSDYHLARSKDIHGNLGEGLFILIGSCLNSLRLLHNLFEHEELVALFITIAPLQVNVSRFFFQLIAGSIENLNSICC